MCGICGVIGTRGSSPDDGAVAAMLARLSHRGPDDEGTYSGPGVCLGTRRLAVIDPAGGHQPLSDDSGDVWLAYNGEIYNFRELRAELEAKGRTFRTNTDTEVAAAAWAEMGEDALDLFNGMFAAAFYRPGEHALALARDRLGIKPLYYWEGGGTLVFASELTALLAHPSVPRQLDPDAVDAYLTYPFHLGGRAIVAGVRRLPPGHLLVWRDGYVTMRRWWQPEAADVPSTIGEARERLTDLIDDAVRLRLVSDVPLGVLLSGGLDSSAVTASAVTAQAGVSTFTIAFEEGAYDESAHAQVVARRLGTDHHVELLTADDLRRAPGEVAAAFDEPLNDSSAIAVYALSRLARRHVTVALGGDGGDELFLGYPRHVAASLAGAYMRLPGPVRRFTERLASTGGESTSVRNNKRRLRRFIAGAALHGADRYAEWIRVGRPRDGLYTPDFAASLGPEAGLRAPEWSHRGGPVEEVDHFDIEHYLPGDLLTKVDRMAMAHSLEVRVPLLDHRLVEFALGIPTAWKLRGLTGKAILREAMGGRLPAGALRREKRGFAVPVGRWFRGPLREMITDELTSRPFSARAIFADEGVRNLLDEHASGLRDHGFTLWALLLLHKWAEANLDHPSPFAGDPNR